MKHVKIESVNMKLNPEINEVWVQQIIADDPSILGIGKNLILLDKERSQPKAGILDLLLLDTETDKRYEVEIQLGATDESHIIRTIEYWDIERKRYPQYEHCAVIVAEDVTTRFLNVINLFNGAIPVMAIQMTALKLNDGIGINFTTILDEMTRGTEEEDSAYKPADRSDWEKRSTPEILKQVDSLAELFQEIDDSLILKYNQAYITPSRNGKGTVFVQFEPTQKHVWAKIKIPEEDELTQRLEESGLDLMGYTDGRYRLRLTPDDISEHSEFLRELFQLAYTNYN